MCRYVTVFLPQVDNNFLPKEYKDNFKDQVSGIIQFVKENPEDVVADACANQKSTKDEEASTQVIEIHVQPASLTKEDDVLEAVDKADVSAESQGGAIVASQEQPQTPAAVAQEAPHTECLVPKDSDNTPVATQSKEEVMKPRPDPLLVKDVASPPAESPVPKSPFSAFEGGGTPTHTTASELDEARVSLEFFIPQSIMAGIYCGILSMYATFV